MKFAYVDTDYISFLEKKIKHVQRHAFGLVVYYAGSHYFIPVSSKFEKYDNLEPNHIKDNHYEIIKNTRGRKVAVLKIIDYYLVDRHSLNYHLEQSQLIKAEIEYVRKHRKIIEDKLKAVLHNHKRVNKRQRMLYKEYYEISSKKRTEYKRFAKRHLEAAVRSMSLVEKIENYVEYVPEIIRNSNIPGMKNEYIDSYSIFKIKRLKDGWQFMLENIEEDLDLDFLIAVNKLVVNEEALYVGKLRQEVGYVDGRHIINPPNSKKVETDISSFLKGNLDNPDRLHRIFQLYIYLIVNQLFVDGNKRTAFIVLNKLLVQNSIGLVIIKDHQIDAYNQLLSTHYKKNSLSSLEELIKFLKDDCLIFAT